MNREKGKVLGNAQFNFCEDRRIYVRSSGSTIKYSFAESSYRKVFKIITRATDKRLFSREILNAIDTKALKYDLSPRRANVLRQIKGLNSSVRVLEFGAGCGVITRYLAELGCEVDAVERSPIKASITSARVSECQNVAVFCSDFADLSFAGEYDMATLLSTIESPHHQFTEKESFQRRLAVAAQAINKDGILVIAINNQLALKSSTGGGARHHTPSHGPEDKYQPGQLNALGKQHLVSALESCGFNYIFFNYPFPDYNLPEAIVSQAGLDCPIFNETDIVCERDLSPDQTIHKSDTSAICDSFSRDLSGGARSKSFLVFAQRNQNDRWIQKELLAEVYTDNRSPAFNVGTSFIKKNKNIFVKKRHLSENLGVVASPYISLRLTTEEYIKGNLLTSLVKSYLEMGDEIGALHLLRRWSAFLARESVNGLLPPDYLDAIPQNFIVTYDNTLSIFDREWVLDTEIERGLVIVRGVFSIVNCSTMGKYFSGSCSEEKARRLCSSLGFSMDFDQYWGKAMECNQWLSQVVYGYEYGKVKSDLKNNDSGKWVKLKSFANSMARVWR